MASRFPLSAAKSRWLSPTKRRDNGVKLRDRVSRADQGAWPGLRNRSDIAAILSDFNKGRLTKLIPVKMGRMAVSPFAFFRGTAPLMAEDLAALPVTGLYVQLCGDAHVRNLGAFAAPDGHLVFDINDFDETIPGPWEWDLKRLAVSVVLAGREAGDSDSVCCDAVKALTACYRKALDRFARMPVIDLAKFEIRRESSKGVVRQLLHKAERLTPEMTLKKLTEPNGESWPVFHGKPPVLEHVPAKVRKKILDSLGAYRKTLGAGRQQVFDAYHSHDVAFKVVGTGSVGTRDYVVLLFGTGPHDPMFLQIKEELPSCYVPYLPTTAACEHQGKRVAQGQQRIQTASDPFLGWTTIDDAQYLVRQLADHKATLDTGELKGSVLAEYASVCGEALAKAHARTSDAIALAAYCGNSNKLDKAIASFAAAYAEQVTSDYKLFMKAIKAGKIKATQPA